MLTLDQSLKT